MDAYMPGSPTSRERDHIDAMCRLTMAQTPSRDAIAYVSSLDQRGRADFLSLADSNHVVLRSLQPVAGSPGEAAAPWAADACDAERLRIHQALHRLAEVCDVLEHEGCPVVVIKTLEHLPDLGNDLDLYSTAPEARVVNVMQKRLQAHVEPRSWGDRLAHKWNFTLPDLRESIEVHVQRLGQTGEHTRLARRFHDRRVRREIAGLQFYVPAPEQAIIVATLQRMYRHFYFRVCDVLNTARLADSGALDYVRLRQASDEGGIWPGVATYLRVVSDYVARYRGRGVDLPAGVLADALFGGEKIEVRSRFLRVPVVPEAATLFTRQALATALAGDVPATFRLTLLPPLASVAAIAYRFTGSDKGIW
jgi:hypothetical protein